MNKNKNIAAAVRKLWGVLIFFVVLQILLIIVANALLNKYASEFEFDTATVEQIKQIGLIVIAVIAVIQDGFFLCRIFRTKALLNAQPMTCIVEDFVITSYRRDKKTVHNVNLLLKEPVSGELYFTYGSHSLSFYNHTVSHSGHNLVEANIFRKDKSIVQLGDSAWLYIRKPAKVTVEIDENDVKLNGKKFKYRNANKNLGPNVFFSVQFIEGAVDVETPTCG